MISRIKNLVFQTLVHRLFFPFLRGFLSWLGRSPRRLGLLEEIANEAQGNLGIGSGVWTSSSGESAVLGILSRTSRKENRPLVIFDVGANHGQFLNLIAGGLEDRPFHIHSFEPSAASFKLLQANAPEKGKGQTLILNPFGLGKSEGSFDLFTDTTASGMASLSKRKIDHLGIEFEQKETVLIQTLDAYCLANSIVSIDLLKVDVEGHELDVFQGAAGMFEKNLVHMVLFEFGGANIDSRTFLRDFYTFFKSHNLPFLYRILPSGILQPIHSYHERLEQFQTSNFLVLSGKTASPS